MDKPTGYTAGEQLGIMGEKMKKLKNLYGDIKKNHIVTCKSSLHKFNFEFIKGDEYFRSSIWINHWWFKRYYCHIIFLI
jgi:hypothetical protein